VAEIIRFARATEGLTQEPGRDTVRIARRTMLVLLRGTMRVVDDLGQDVDLTGPAVVQWWPGEHVSYGTPSDGAEWLLLEAAPRPHPDGSPVPGSRVVLTDEEGSATLTGTVIMYMDTSPDGAGVDTVAVEVDGQGVGHFPPGRLVEVLEEPH
jgi:hypothetical protein